MIMTEDDQLLYDEFQNLKELEARADRQAGIYEESAREERARAADYRARADVLAKQLGFVS